MTDEAMTEQQVNLFLMVKEKLAARIKTPCPVEIQVAVFNAVHHWQITLHIDKTRETQYTSRQQQQDEPASTAQKNYAYDLGIEYPEDITKKKLSELIKAKVG